MKDPITYILLGVLILLVAYGTFFKSPQAFAGTSPAGSSFTTPKFYGVAVNLASPGSTGTSTSLTNTDANDRYVTGYRYACQGIGSSNTAYSGGGLASLFMKIGTTTTAAPATFSSNIPVSNGMTIATSTPINSVASSTAQLGNAALWRSGEILTFYFNATNTATCTIGVDTIAS